ncbi:phosphoesterase [Symmachiella dynata]|uniref:phosphoesterase n=1 Tax=Symmachiella dynata TaxID=2527995 RepID=UPI0030EBE052
MTSTTVEQILVVPTSLFREIGYFEGLSTNVQPYLETLLDPIHTSYQPRDVMEADPEFKQLIPYCIFQHAGEIFYYTRGGGQGEKRLHAKRSIGIGGHVSSVDENQADSPYLEGMRREIDEEVHVESPYTDRCVGMLNDDSNDVGKVHLGIVHVFDLEEPKIRPREKDMLETGFASPEQLLAEIDQFETWSQICLKALFS